ncbi:MULTISPECIES: hypothetical protein [unclassified Rhodococcus (in: high G+C Gram-positive bacteria)]|uniref:hypothetical protein n=1 Tax=unclassified Rhodococcus (in: high G+C Gram-positive bacteria) TaxID=192944 RepID=UPI0027E0671F|nr:MULTISPECIES: hypothetical protein [unclassified Rhodococcus (in: high G+C Gram-positive bacteria)]
MRAVSAASVVALIVAVLVLGVLNPVRGSSVRTDALGPDNDETAAQYVARVDPPSGDGDRWALVSFTRSMRADEIAPTVDGIRVSVVYAHVPIDRVQTPLVVVPVPDTDSVLASSVRLAAGLVPPGRDERGNVIATVVRARLQADCDCAAGVLVRASVPELAALAGLDGIRAVEALPGDAVYGRFAVAPLYPERDGDAVQPDDGPVPAS